MNISQRGINAIKLFEGSNKRGDLHYAYLCPAGKWTCGYGTTTGVTKDTVWTEAQATSALAHDLLSAEADVNAMCKVPLTQNEFDALVSFCQNLGRRNGATLWKKLAVSDKKGAADEILKWNQVAGKFNDGVYRRRQAEREIFLNAKYPEKW